MQTVQGNRVCSGIWVCLGLLVCGLLGLASACSSPRSQPSFAESTAPLHTTITVASEAHPPLAHPLQPLTLTLQIADYSGAAEILFYDVQDHITQSIEAQVQNGIAHIAVLPRGRLGPRRAVVQVDGHVTGSNAVVFILEAATTIQTGQPDIDRLYPTIRSFLGHNVVSYELNRVPVHGYRSPDNPLLWLRDHVYQGRGFRYFDADVTSLLDAFRRAQRDDGSFPDVLSYPALGVTAHRMEPESDLEYLFVQGVYEAWQASGDDTWLQANMQAMRRGLTYITSDPLRWDTQHGLVRRPYTIDTWDFQVGPTTTSPDGQPSPRHWIDDQTVWGIFHGDNTGLAYALKLMERMEQHLGNTAEAERWREQRVGMMRRLNDLSWNGHFFRHFVPLEADLTAQGQTLLDSIGVDTKTQLSLSNTYALNREVLASYQAHAIIQAYFTRRDFARAFAEWYSIDPPFPEGRVGMGGKKGALPGEYVNGGIMPLVGGELARGAFRYGAEAYGFDILQRYAELLRLTDQSYLWYYPDGRPGISGPHTLATDGWGSSAMLGALIEGAAGVFDRSSGYRDLDLSPRWAALPSIHTAYVVVRYAASDSYVAYTWHSNAQGLQLHTTGTWEQARIRLLLPTEAPKRAQITTRLNGQPIETILTKAAGSRYILVETTGPSAHVELLW